MLSTQNIESELSYAYLHAVASRAGIICEYSGRHTDEAGVDAVLRVKGKLAEESVLTHFTTDVQLKATMREAVEQNGRFSYNLRMKNYNDLRSESTIAPQLLVVLFLPDDAALWLSHSDEGLISRKCAYWLSLRGAPDSNNDSLQSVYIPKTNLLSVESLTELMARFSQRETIAYAT